MGECINVCVLRYYNVLVLSFFLEWISLLLNSKYVRERFVFVFVFEFYRMVGKENSEITFCNLAQITNNLKETKMDFGQNIEALVRGENLTTHQKALAKMEYECWKDEYLKIHEELSKLRQDAVSGRSEQLKAFCQYCETRQIQPKRFKWDEVIKDFESI